MAIIVHVYHSSNLYYKKNLYKKYNYNIISILNYPLEGPRVE